MADRKADRKRKGKAVSSSSQVVPRFKTLYHEAHFNSTLSARRILPELILQADENVFNPIRFQIHQRKWDKFTKPIQAVGHLMIKEFYANAWEPDKAKRKPYTYTSTVRGTDVSFAPSNIKRVLKLRKDSIPNAPSYHERKANKDYRLDHVLEDMCEEGAYWVRHRDGRPHFLRRSDLEPMSKDARIPAISDDTLIPQEPPIVAEAMTRTREARAKNPRQARQETPLNNNHLKINSNPNSNINKISLQVSTLTSTPPCPKSIGGLTNNKKKIGGALRPSTQEWTEWMIN
ncbi:hypothetical protein PIB30_078022 [Stylosanthes scabra]|uniref:Putative plant transposon protein domain-containing protein n=1 Tax=Stylosanthes scabra TaxID=79078 RepID=A0ABU6UPL1_9FABA|nr:hypothetical protein [Stylosanthes scabra]